MQNKTCALQFEKDEQNLINKIYFTDDPHAMNWIEGVHALGETVTPKKIVVQRTVVSDEQGLTLSVRFTNYSALDIFANTGSVGIYIPFNDSYPSAALCMTNRCHAHIFCGKEISYILGLRMGGNAPHLGMYLTEGSLDSYSVTDTGINDRGDFLFHPSPFHLRPGQSYTISMRFFRHNGREDFFRILRADMPDYFQVKANHYTVFPNERLELSIVANTDIRSISVSENEQSFPVKVEQTAARCSISADTFPLGEHSFEIVLNGKHTRCVVFFSAPLSELLAARCRFIAKKQQLNDPDSMLHGAYLCYDNQTDEFIYSGYNQDYNAGRERLAMPILLAMYLQKHPDQELENSLKLYMDFFMRELFDAETGIVFDDADRTLHTNRLYNYPWAVKLFLELYLLDGALEHLEYAYRAMRRYYRFHGERFYAFTIPIRQILTLLQTANMQKEYEELLSYFCAHAEVMIQNATNYPKHEVAYEQSIVAPAAKFLLELYEVTHDERYLVEATKQMQTMALFSGTQPDYHLYACAIRHWDDYWFGKRKLFGDTFPHYWNALSADAFYAYAKAQKDADCLQFAIDAYRVQCCLFSPNGSASCAMLYPLFSSGTPGHFFDEWANDQDWALVYYLEYLRSKE